MFQKVLDPSCPGEANASNQGSILVMYFFMSQNEMIVHWQSTAFLGVTWRFLFMGRSLETKNLTHLPRETDYWEKSTRNQLQIHTLSTISQCLV